MSWQPVIGLEIHVQLLTASKIFSAADNTYGGAPNSKACPVDLGLPGVLPVLNENAVKMAIKFGLAIGAKINQESIFDRKNYFYPDLPKGYQISQFEKPIVGEGKVTIDSDSGEKTSIRITRAHLEEDAGKSTHDMFATETAIDLNRTGTPLLEIVSEPDLHSAKDAATYFRTIQELVKYLKICDGDLSRGSMRCDANVSIKKSEATELGERTEIKNINSFRFVEQAINSEIQRQIEVIEAGGRIERETRLFDEIKNETKTLTQGFSSISRSNFVVGALMFAKPKEGILGPLETTRGHALIELVDVSSFDSTEFEVQKGTLKKNLFSRKQSQLFQTWLTELKSKADIVDNRKFYF